jgi:hypothetical protein
VESNVALEDRYGARHLAVGHRRQPKKRTQGDGGSRKKLAAARSRMTRRAVPARRKGRGHKGPRVEKRRQKSGPWTMLYAEPLKDGRSTQQWHKRPRPEMGSNKTFYEALGQTHEFEVMKRAVDLRLGCGKWVTGYCGVVGPLRNETRGQLPEKNEDGGTPGPAGSWGIITVRTEPWGGRRGRSQTSQAQPSEKKKCRYACRLLGPNSLKEGAMQHVDPLLGGDREIGDCTAAVAWQRPTNNRKMVFSTRSAKQLLNSNTGTIFSTRSVPRGYTQN